VLIKAPGDFYLIPGASGLAKVAALGEYERNRLVNQMRDLERKADLLMIDVGAGVSPNVLSFALASDQLLVVTTPEPPAVTDAYALIKTAARNLEQPDLDLVVNMARDEALLERAGRGESPPTLRFYQWSEPTISLGYFQHYADYEQLPPPAGKLPVVRRQTGGGAILHDQELTYSITLPLDHALLKRGPNCLYEIAHDALIDVLERLGVRADRQGQSDGSGAAKGPFFCFQRRHRLDVLIGPDKIAGSAQRRTRSAVLQHGSIILKRRFEQQPAATLPEEIDVTPAQLAERFADALRHITQVSYREGEWKPEELQAAAALECRYAGNEWTKRT